MRACRRAVDSGHDDPRIEHGLHRRHGRQCGRDATVQDVQWVVEAYRYGSAIENRARLLMEVVEAVSEVWDADRVGVRLSPLG